MTQRFPVRFSLVRYVPDIVKGEYVNIGLVMRVDSSDPGASPLIYVCFTRNWSRVLGLDPQADVDLLDEIAAEVQGETSVEPRARDLSHWLDQLRDTCSNSIQLSEENVSLATDMVSATAMLMQMYVEPMPAPESGVRDTAPANGRFRIRTAMHAEFEKVGALRLMRSNTPARLYTRKGDLMHIDCAYSEGVGTTRRLHFFQAVSLFGTNNMARVLAQAAPQLREGAASVEGAALDITAVVEPEQMLTSGGSNPDAQDAYRFGREILQESGISVVTLDNLQDLAATAGRLLSV